MSQLQDLINETIRAMAKREWDRLMAKQEEIQKIVSSHDWDRPRINCLRCGIIASEFHFSRPRPLCTGDAYICRVARKLFDHQLVLRAADEERHNLGSDVAQWDGTLLFRRCRPWTMDARTLAIFIRFVLRRFDVEWPPVVTNLLRACEEHPGRCPILADALEEAGCEDRALLQALRTP